MNSGVWIGRLVRDPEVKYTSTTQKAVCRFTLACDNGKDQNGNKREADFIPCVAWEKKAEAIEKYLHKGMMFAVKGKLQSASYEDREGNKHNTLNVFVQEIQFIDFRDEQPKEHQESMNGFEQVDEDVPF